MTSLVLPWGRKPVAAAPEPVANDLAGIIDIGSNSVRLVVYAGRTRTPAVIFNEKVMAGLGRGLAGDGRLTEGSMRTATAALARFALLARDMGVTDLRTVATAAVREARNGQRFVDAVRDACGLAIEVIDGEAEARGAALGVIAGIPGADGVVGDLGGGSLELIRIAGGCVHDRISLPIGALRLDAVRKRGSRALRPFIATALKKVEWAAKGQGKPFYMVGGSWRALAQLDIWSTDYPLPVIQQYTMAIDAPARLARSLARVNPKTLKQVTAISTSRLPSLPGAALLLGAVVKRLGSTSIVASAYGLREGLLYERMPPGLQGRGPAPRRRARRGRAVGTLSRTRRPVDDVDGRRVRRTRGTGRRWRSGAPACGNLPDASPAARDVPAQRHRVARPSRFPRGARHGHRAPRQLGGNHPG